MKIKINNGLQLLSTNLVKWLRLAKNTQKLIWVRMLSIVALVYSASFCMAFTDVSSPSALLMQASANIQHPTYEGVVTIVGDKVILKTHKYSYVVQDPDDILQKSPNFAKDSRLQSFRVCLKGQRSAAKEYVYGSYSYMLTITQLC